MISIYLLPDSKPAAPSTPLQPSYISHGALNGRHLLASPRVHLSPPRTASSHIARPLEQLEPLEQLAPLPPSPPSKPKTMFFSTNPQISRPNPC